MQGFSWVWPGSTEAENASDRARHSEIIAGLIREAQQAGDVSPALDPVLAAEAVFAIYTWGLCGVVFQGLTPEQCHARFMEVIRSSLA
jgi:hypothetical protein